MKHVLHKEWSQHRCACGVKLQSEREWADHLVELLDQAEQALVELKAAK